MSDEELDMLQDLASDGLNLLFEQMESAELKYKNISMKPSETYAKASIGALNAVMALNRRIALAEAAILILYRD